MKKIDTHMHLLYPEELSYPWVQGIPALQSSFKLDEYRRASSACEVVSGVFMEVDVPEEQAGLEARFFCQQCENPTSGISGVVASGRPEQDHFPEYLDSIAHPSLKGIRRVLHVVPDAVSQSMTFRRHIAALAERDLTFDICVRADQLPLVLELVDACAQTQFILDHCGCPDIAAGNFEPWKALLEELAKREHVAVKISGLPTYCPPGRADAEMLRPWVETALEAFDWDRSLWGGDWPVCTLNSTLLDWCKTLDTILANESAANLQKLYRKNAQKVYRL